MVGTDSPAGSGVQPLGMLRTVSWLAALGGVDPAAAVAAATGNVAALHRLNTGMVAPAARGTCSWSTRRSARRLADAFGALAIGDTLAVATAIIDGVPRYAKSRNTPPPVRAISIS